MKSYFFGTVIWFSCVAAANAATYSFDILSSSEGFGGNAVPNSTSMNDSGTFAGKFVFRDPPNGSASDNMTTIRTTDIQNNSTFNAPVQGGISGTFQYRDPIINNAGQFLVLSSRESLLGEALEIVEPNGSRRTVAIRGQNIPANPGAPVFGSFVVVGGGFNDNGDIAAIVTTLDNRIQIVRFDGQSGAVDVLAEPDSTTFNFSNPVINSSGEVAWTAQISGGANGLTHGVYTSDGTGVPERRLGLFANGGSGLGPAINDAGNVLAYQPSAIAFGQPGGDPDAAGQEIYIDADLAGFVSSLGLNDFDQNAFSDQDGIVVDGERIISVGDQLAGTLGTVISASFRGNSGFNNNGQVLAAVNTQYEDENGFQQHGVYLIRANPEGASPDNPLLPFASTPEGENDVAINIFNGLGVDAPIWVDPVVATAFTYSQGIGGANFASLIIPEALPLGDDSFILEFLYGGGTAFSGVLGIGSIFDFTAFDPLGISEFTIGGIDVGEGIDPIDPFVVGLTFVSGGFQSTLSIDAKTFDIDGGGGNPSPVPLPATLPLLLIAVGGLARKFRKAKRV